MCPPTEHIGFSFFSQEEEDNEEGVDEKEERDRCASSAVQPLYCHQCSFPLFSPAILNSSVRHRPVSPNNTSRGSKFCFEWLSSE